MNYTLPLASLRLFSFLFPLEKIFSFFYKSVLIVLLLTCSLTSFGQTTATNGDWNVGTTWIGGTSPLTNVTGAGTTTTVIVDNKNITLSNGITVTVGNNYSIVTKNNGTLVITGDVVINGTGTLDFDGNVVINGNLTLGSGSSINVKNNHSLQVTGNVSIDGGISVNGILTIGGTLTKTGTSSSITVSNTSVLQVGSDASITGDLTATAGATLKFGGKLNLTSSVVNINNSSTTLEVTGDVNMVSSTLQGTDSKWLFLSNFTADGSSSIIPPTNSGAYMAVAGNFAGKITTYPSPYNLYVGGTNSGTSSDLNFTQCNGSGTLPHPSSGCNIGNWTDFINQNSPFVTTYIPATPGAITGSTTVCPAKAGVVYSVVPVLFATSYEWTVPTGATINGSATGSSITVDFASFAGGTISAKAKNAFGVSSAVSASIGVFTISAPIISGLTPACEASTGNIYTTEPNGANYNWLVSAGGTITSGGATGDNSVTVSWPTVGAQSVSVKYTDVNGCESGVTSVYPVMVNQSYTPSVVITSSPVSGCQGIPVTFTATPTNGGATPLYNWWVNSSSITSSSANTFTYSITAYDAVKCIMTSSACSLPATNPTTSNVLTKVLKHNEITLATISPSAFCAGSVFNATITVPCDFPLPNIFTILLSDASGSFASSTVIGSLSANLAGSYLISCTIPAATVTGTNYQVQVSSTYANVLDGKSLPSNKLTISSYSGTAISPTIYGTTGWNVFCYSGTSTTMSANTYMGYYTENNLSFDSRTRWTSGDTPAAANSLTGLAYQGCSSMPASNIALSFMRTNIPCGYYQINIPYHDDAYELYIDNVKQASHNGCCDIHTNVWTGWINTSTKVEFRLFQGGGGSGLQVSFVNSNPLVVSPIVTTVCSAFPTILTATGGGAGVTYNWVPATGLDVTSGSSVTASPTTTTNYTVTATDGSSLCMASAIVTVNVASSITLGVSASPTTTVCGGVTSTTLTATGANTYTWTSAPSGFTATGSSVSVSPTVTTVYTVTGSIGTCTSPVSKPITITGMNPSSGAAIDTADFGNGTWNALCHATTTFTDYYGYYTENNLSFNTATRWAASSLPSGTTAGTGSAYSGCTLPATYSIRFKRTDISCGYYSLTVNYHDDGASFWVDGKQVWANTGYVSTVDPNVWTGFLGPSSKVELRLINTGGSGRLDVSFAPAIPNTLSTPATICAGTSTTLSTTTMAGAVYSWSAQNVADASWLSTTSGATTVATPPLLTPDGIHNFICTTNDATGTGCSVDQILPLEVRALANTAVTPLATTVNCPSANVKLTASGANTYTWTSTPAGFSATGAIVTVNPSTTTTYTVVGSNNCNSVSASSTITVNSLPDPASYPTGKWNAYIYNSTATTTPLNYTGSYSFTDATADDYSFNTTNQYGSSASPSSATGYVGCSIGATNYTVVYRRTGFTCGYYQIDIPGHDDAAYLYIDGALKWSHTTCCDAHTAVWTGYLTSASQVDLRFTNGGGPGYLITKFTKVSPIVSISPTSPAVCSGSTVGVDLTVTANGTGNSYSWSPTTSAPTSATTNANPLVTTVYTVSVSNCSGTVMGSKSITVDVLSPSVIGTQPLPQNVCEGTNAVFSITSSNPMGFVWQLSSDGINWNDMTNGGVYTGALTKELDLTAVPYSLNGMKYRCKTTVCLSVFSLDALLTVKQAPTLTLGGYKIAGLCAKNFSIPFSTTGSPTVYSLGSFGTSAAITDATLSSSPLLILIPPSLTEGTYTPSLKVKDVASGCESLPVTLSLILKKVTPFSVYCKKNK